MKSMAPGRSGMVGAVSRARNGINKRIQRGRQRDSVHIVLSYPHISYESLSSLFAVRSSLEGRQTEASHRGSVVNRELIPVNIGS